MKSRQNGLGKRKGDKYLQKWGRRGGGDVHTKMGAVGGKKGGGSCKKQFLKAGKKKKRKPKRK